MLSRLASESTPRSTIAKPNKMTSRAIGSVARQSHWLGSSFVYPLSLAATDNSISDTGLSPSAEFVQCHGGHHDDTEKNRLEAGVDVQEIHRVAADRVDIPAKERTPLREHRHKNHGERDIDRSGQAKDLGAPEAFHENVGHAVYRDPARDHEPDAGGRRHRA